MNEPAARANVIEFVASQARLEDLVLVTRDPLVRQYDGATMPA